MIPLVLVHGFLGGSAQWQGLREFIGDEREVIALDLPGYGDNAHLSAFDRIEGFAGWVVDRLQQQGIGSYHLLGHSMGGMIAQEIARIDGPNLESLILYGTGTQGALPGRFEPIEESKRRATEDGAEATASRIAAMWLRDREASEHFPMIEQVARRGRLEAILAGLDAMQAWDGRKALQNISTRSLVVWGDLDRTYPWSQTKDLWEDLSGAHLCVLPRCAHLAHLEHAAVFNNVIAGFLAEG